jgi:hypothetical protein
MSPGSAGVVGISAGSIDDPATALPIRSCHCPISSSTYVGELGLVWFLVLPDGYAASTADRVVSSAGVT